jgi:hypothetical protein
MSFLGLPLIPLRDSCSECWCSHSGCHQPEHGFRQPGGYMRDPPRRRLGQCNSTQSKVPSSPSFSSVNPSPALSYSRRASLCLSFECGHVQGASRGLSQAAGSSFWAFQLTGWYLGPVLAGVQTRRRRWWWSVRASKIAKGI